MSKEILKKELKSAEQGSKDKVLKIVYDELDTALKGYNELEKFSEGPTIVSPKIDEYDKRIEVAYLYLKENFNDDYLKKSAVQPTPLVKETLEVFKESDEIGEKAERAARGARRSALKAAFSMSKNVDWEMLKHESRLKEVEFKQKIDENMNKIELSPYKRRLQNMIKERTGR